MSRKPFLRSIQSILQANLGRFPLLRFSILLQVQRINVVDKESVFVVIETDEVRRGALAGIRCEEVSGTLVSITPYEHVGYRVAVEYRS